MIVISSRSLDGTIKFDEEAKHFVAFRCSSHLFCVCALFISSKFNRIRLKWRVHTIPYNVIDREMWSKFQFFSAHFDFVASFFLFNRKAFQFSVMAHKIRWFEKLLLYPHMIGMRDEAKKRITKGFSLAEKCSWENSRYRSDISLKLCHQHFMRLFALHFIQLRARIVAFTMILLLVILLSNGWSVFVSLSPTLSIGSHMFVYLRLSHLFSSAKLLYFIQ